MTNYSNTLLLAGILAFCGFASLQAQEGVPTLAPQADSSELPGSEPAPLSKDSEKTELDISPRPETGIHPLQQVAVFTGPWFCYQYKTWQFQGEETPCDPTDDYWYWWTNRHDVDDCDDYTGGIYPAHGSESFQNCPTDGSGCGKPSVCCSTGTAWKQPRERKNYVSLVDDPYPLDTPTRLAKRYSEDYQPKWGPDQEEFLDPEFVEIKTGETVRYTKVFFVKIDLGIDPETGIRHSHFFSIGIEVEKDNETYRRVACEENKGFPGQWKGNVSDVMVTYFITSI